MHSDKSINRPTLPGTVGLMGTVCLAIWRDYRAFQAQASRSRRLGQRFALSPTRWQDDTCHLLVVGLTVIGVLSLVLHLAGAWGALFALLGVA